MPTLVAANSVSPKRAICLALLVVLAGCTGVSPGNGAPSGPANDATDSTTELPTGTTGRPTETTDDGTTERPTDGGTTEPHTGVGTSHAPEHFSVRAGFNAENVTVTLAPDSDSETYALDAGAQLDLTREIHERGHDVRVVVERGNETVFDQTVLGYEYYDITVYQNDTSVEHAMV